MSSTSNSSNRHLVLKCLLMAFGGLIFALLIRHYGTRETLRSLKAVWPAIPLMVMIEGFAKLANALGMRRALTRDGRRTSFLEVLRLMIESEAVNYLIPSASLGGNALLTRGLMRRGTLSDSIVAVATASSTQTIAQFLLVLAGSALALAATPIPASLRPAVWGAMAVSVATVCIFLLIMVKGVFVFLSSVLRRFRIGARFLRERERQFVDMDERLRKVLLTRPADIALSILFYGCGWSVSAAELFVALSLMGVAFRWQQALAIHALAVFIDGVVFFIPAKAGSQEGGKILAFTAVGLTGSAGLIFGLLRRAREIIWALVGYASLALRVREDGASIPPRPALAPVSAS